MKTILIPTDFSYNSLKAVQFAFDFFNQKGNKFILSHVYNVPVGGQSGLLTLMEQIRVQAEKSMQEFEKLINQKFLEKNVTLSSTNLQGDFSSEINALAKSKKVDFILMGAKGVSGMKEVLIGSNTSYLIKHSTTPVFALPTDYDKSSIDELIFSYDGEEIQPKEVSLLLNFLNENDLPASLLHVRNESEKPIQNWGEIKKLFDNRELSLYEVFANNFEDGLKKAIVDRNAILVLIRRKKSFWENLINDSDSQKVVKHFQLPILVLPE